MAEDMTIGGITWHSSEEDGGPDVGISIYLGDNQRLWIGEITSQLFDQSGRGHFDSDGGWFLVWYKPEPVLIAKCADDLDARDFIEHIASRLRLSAQQREPVVKQLDWIERKGVTGTFDANTSIGHYIATTTDDNRGMWFIVGQTTGEYMQPDLDAVRAAAQADYEQRIMAAIEITPAGAGESSDAVAQGDC